MKDFTISQLAQKSHVNIQTIRFYERKGLIPNPPRSQSGYRQYSQDSVARIKFIRNAKELGFSLREVSELLSLRVDPNTSCDEVKTMAEHKIANIEEKIQALQRIKNALKKLRTECNEQGPDGKCPILEALDSD